MEKIIKETVISFFIGTVLLGGLVYASITTYKISTQNKFIEERIQKYEEQQVKLLTSNNAIKNKIEHTDSNIKNINKNIDKFTDDITKLRKALVKISLKFDGLDNSLINDLIGKNPVKSDGIINAPSKIHLYKLRGLGDVTICSDIKADKNSKAVVGSLDLSQPLTKVNSQITLNNKSMTVENEEVYFGGTQLIYVVKKGDNLSTISNKFGTSVRKIKELNKLTTETIYPGQKIIIMDKFDF